MAPAECTHYFLKMSSDSNLENVFTKVSYKRKGKTKKKINKQVNQNLRKLTDNEPFNKESNIRRINEAKEELLNTDLYQSVLALLKEGLSCLNNPKVSRIICFGLGTISELTVPRFQLALLLHLKDLFQVEAEASDPIFNNNDVCLLRHFSIGIQKSNFEGKYYIDDQDIVLFYLPHCPKQLMNNLLWANWGLNLNRCVIIGNSINKTIEDNPKRVLRSSAEYIAKICPYVLELGFVNNFKLFEVFNDTSIHFFPFSKLKMLSLDFWELHDEPEYSDSELEFVRKDFQNKFVL